MRGCPSDGDPLGIVGPVFRPQVATIVEMYLRPMFGRSSSTFRSNAIAQSVLDIGSAGPGGGFEPCPLDADGVLLAMADRRNAWRLIESRV
jgi:hypothetical protein